MSNDYFNASGSPSTGSTASSAVIRAEYTAIQAAFDKLAALTGNGGKLLRVNAGGTAQEALNLNAGQILYGGASNGVSQSNNFTWNTTNNTLAITGNVGISGNVLTTGTVGNTTGRVGTGYFVNINANGAAVLSSTLSVAGQASLNNTSVTNLNIGTGIQLSQADALSKRLLISDPSAPGDTAVRIIIGTNNLLFDAVTGNSSLVEKDLIFQPNGGNTAFGGPLNVANTLNVAGTISVVGNATFNNMNLAGVLTGTPSMLSPLNNSLAADVVLNNTSAFFDGPSVAQGNNGTWFASGMVTVKESTLNNSVAYYAKLWDGNIVIASGATSIYTTGASITSISLSGFITSPSGNIRISVKGVTTNTGNIMWNNSGLGKDSTITAIRIG
jgi:hypothetical protein